MIKLINNIENKQTFSRPNLASNVKMKKYSCLIAYTNLTNVLQSM